MRHCRTVSACIFLFVFFGRAESLHDSLPDDMTAGGDSSRNIESHEIAVKISSPMDNGDSQSVDTRQSHLNDSSQAAVSFASPPAPRTGASLDSSRQNFRAVSQSGDTNVSAGADKRKPVVSRMASVMRRSGKAPGAWLLRMVRRYALHFVILMMALGVIALTAAFFIRKRDNERFLTTTRLSVVDKEVRRTCNFIEKNYGNPGLSPENICNAMVSGAAFLEALFHRELGMSLEDFIVHVRMNRARILLGQTPYISIETLAESVGYIDTDDFTHAFYKITGVTIDEYRKKS